jgi:two-component system sensor histidine kinase KdpD
MATGAPDLAPFADALAHELMTPARIIAGNVEILRGRAVTSDAHAAAVAAIAGGSQRLDVLLDGLVRFARAGHPAGERVAVDVGEEARAVVAGLRDEIASARAEVAVGSLPVVLAEPRSLRIVLRCLLENALRSRPGGGPRVEITGATQPRAWRLTVSDDGSGVPEAERERVFEAFARCGDRHGGGLGLGLTLTRAIVERHGGRITLADGIHGGTSADVILPRPLDESTTAGD